MSYGRHPAFFMSLQLVSKPVVRKGAAIMKACRQLLLGLCFASSMISTAHAEDTKHRFLGSGYGSGNIFIIDRQGEMEWEHRVRGVQDVFMLPDGSIVYQDAESVKCINMKKEVLMEYKTEREVHSVSALANGNYLVSLSGQSKVVEIDNKGNVVKEILVDSKDKDAHMQMRDSEFTVDGTYLVALCRERKIQEYDRDGKLIRVIDGEKVKEIGMPSDVQRLKNGNTLIATGYGRPSLVEIDRNDRVVWSVAQEEIKGLTMKYAAAAVRLPNGNTLISLYKGSHLFVEITADKKIVWGLKADAIKGITGATSIQYLD
jgi:hypothetical protein